MAWTCLAANGTGSLLFMEDDGRSNRMNPEGNRAELSAQVQQNADGQCFTVQRDNDPEHVVK